jgi:serine/threonine-protein kinase
MPVPLPAETTLRFAVLGELAMGGMGRVDLARVVGGDPDATGRVVAIKRLHPHLARDPQFVQGFLDEVSLTAALRHPNVVELAGWGRDAEGVFLAMEFVEGAPLQHVARNGRAAGEPLTPELVAHLGVELAAALDAAHALTGPDGAPLGLVHRDVTPSNVLVGFDGAVKLTDFGIARAAGKSSHTATGILKGKVLYMAPEYARARSLDHRADLYSLGVVLYELASGKRPFSAPHDLELLRLVAEAPPAPIEGVEARLASLVMRLLAKDPAERLPTALAVKDELSAFLVSRAVTRDACVTALAAYAQSHASSHRERIDALLAGSGASSTAPAPAPFAAGPRLSVAPEAEAGPNARVLEAGALAAPGAFDPTPAPAPMSAPTADRAALADPTGMDAFADSVVGAAHTRPDVASRAPLTGARLAALAAATFLGVAAVLAGVIAIAARATQAVPASVAQAAPSPAGVSAPSSKASTSAPTEPVPSAAPPMPSARPSAMPSVGAAEPSAVASAPVASSARPAPRPPSRRKVSCTPTDFDYPSCLSKAR